MRPVLPLAAAALLAALPAAAAGHHHGGKSHAGNGGSSAASAAPSALNTPYDYGTADAAAKAGATTDGGKPAKAAKDDLAGYNLPNTGAARKHGKAQTLPAY